MDDPLNRLRDEIANHAAEIETLFKDRVNVTIIVRNLDHPNRNAVVSNETDFSTVVNSDFLKTVL